VSAHTVLWRFSDKPPERLSRVVQFLGEFFRE
jgi:hypothetical protein